MTNIINGWFSQASQHPTTQCDERPDPEDISLMVLHCISLPPGEFGGEWISRLFDGSLPGAAHPYFEGIQSLRVSAHILIRRDGSMIQYVPFQKRAWHAGVSRYQDRTHCNDFSIGIELEGTDTLPYEGLQYTALSGLIQALIQHYPRLTTDTITSHSSIAPGRKTDPGPGFDWDMLRELLQTAR